MNVRPFRLVSEGDLARVGKSAQKTLDAWSAEWVPGGAGISTVKEVRPFEHSRVDESPAVWKTASTLEGRWCAVRFLPGLGESLGMLLLGRGQSTTAVAGSDDAGGVMLSRLAERALFDLAIRLVGGEPASKGATDRLHGSTLPGEPGLPGSGCVWIDVRVGEIELPLVMSWDALAQYLVRPLSISREASDPLVQRQDALRNREVRLRVHLGSASITVDALTSLSIGDVIRLDRRIDEPATMMLGDEISTCNGFLGKDAGLLALRVVKGPFNRA
jgi:hypothetical protein